MTKKPGRPMTRLIEPIPATPEEVAAAICRDATIRQSLGPPPPTTDKRKPKR